MYKCVGITVLGSYVRFFLRVSPGGGTEWEERNPVGMGGGTCGFYG